MSKGLWVAGDGKSWKDGNGNKRSGRPSAKDFYQNNQQHRTGLLAESSKKTINYFVEANHSWSSQISSAIQAVETAAPRLDFIQVYKTNDAAITIWNGKDNYLQHTSGAKKGQKIWNLESGEAWCRGNINAPTEETGRTVINLGNKRSATTGTAVHELLHALGFQHEHKRGDSCFTKSGSKFGIEFQYKSNDSMCFTPYDETSIMHYNQNTNDCLSCTKGSRLLKVSCSCKFTFGGTSLIGQRKEMSPLDKLGLNLMYPPCRRASGVYGGPYMPKKSSKQGLYYCGRSVMGSHNGLGGRTNYTDGRCGPTNGANCPSCMVLSGNRTHYGKWQGFSGLFYCGKWMGKQSGCTSGYCGPNNGKQCSSCAQKNRRC